MKTDSITKPMSSKPLVFLYSCCAYFQGL